MEDTSGKSTTENVAITVGEANTEPLCSINEPTSGAAYLLGQNITSLGTATDEEINNSLLSISWESDVDGVFDTTGANSAGDLTFIYDGLTAGNHTITLKVEDDVGGLCTDSILLTVGSAPLLTLTKPTSVDLYQLGDSVTFTATVSDAVFK